MMMSGSAAILAQTVPAEGASSVPLVIGMVLFAALGLIICFGGLIVGWIVRPRVKHPEKQAIYECGEPTIGPGWVQFDLRFYAVALVFVIFDIEVALFWPWAVVFGQGDHQVKMAAVVDMLFFFGVVVVGFLYLWRYGYLDWVRDTSAQGEDSVLEAEAAS